MQTIVVPLDRPDSERALPVARRLAAESSARIVVVHVVRLYPKARGNSVLHYDEPETQARLRDIVAGLRRDGIPAELEITGGAVAHTGDLIADAAERHRASAIVLATRGHGPILGWLRKSVARRLLRAAPCPVLTLTPRSDGDTLLAPQRHAPALTIQSVAVGQ